jgi:predicted phage tail component-like protein
MSIVTTFNSTSLATLGFTTHNVRGRDLGRQDRSSIDTPQRPGATELSKKFPPNTLKVEGRLEGSSYSNLEATIFPAFLAALYTDEDKTLSFDDKSTKYYNAQYDGFKLLKEESLFRILEIDFLCVDPFAYDTTADTDTQSSVTTNDTTYNVTNSGHYYCYPTATITFNQAQDHIYIQNNTIEDCRFDISQSFAAADELIINFKTGVVTLNGSETYAGIGVGGSELAEMIRLAVGVNQMQFGTADATLNCDILLRWEKAYLS